MTRSTAAEGGDRPLSGVTLRVARATNDLASVVRFYRDGLGLQLIDHFENHDGIDGVMLGFPGAPYHLEFTSHAGETVSRAPSKDTLLVYYVPDRERWDAIVAGMAAAGYAPVPSANPYWDRSGRTYEDPDGYRVVIQNAAWEV